MLREERGVSLFVERRRPPFSAELTARVTLAWAMIAALLLVTNMPAIAAGFSPGPSAVSAGLIVIPLVTLFACLMLIGRIAGRLLGEEIALLACLVFAFCVPVIEHFRPMRIDQHGWQIACVLLVMNGLMARSARRGGWLVGAGLALGLAISLEGLPFAVAVLAVLAWRWLRARSDRQWLVSALQSLTVGSAALFLVTRNWAPATGACDGITPMHLAAFAWSAAVVTVCSRLEPQPRLIVGAAFALLVGGVLVIAAHVVPGCPGAPLGFTRSSLPIWHQPLPMIVQLVLPPGIAICAASKLAGRSSSWLRQWWTQYAALLIAAFAISIFDARAGAIAGALAAVPLGWQLREWLRGARNLKRRARRAAAYGGLVLALIPAAPALLLAGALRG